MPILDQLRNSAGIQALNTDFQNGLAAGHGYLIPHTNGRVYCVFARNYFNAVEERRLFISYSEDQGQTWTVPTQLTSGNWDNNPCGLQLTESDDIGIVFTRRTSTTSTGDDETALSQFSVDPDTLSLTTAIGEITPLFEDYKYPSVVKTSAGYAVFAIPVSYGSNPQVRRWESSEDVFFEPTSWADSDFIDFWGTSDLAPFSLSVRRLSNGHLAAVSAVRTAANGGTGGSDLRAGQVPPGIFKLDVYVVFSDDDGVTWGTPQNLTSYAGDPDLSLSGLKSALDADLVELSDGTIVVAFGEGFTPQFIGDSTDLSLSTSIFNTAKILYHATHDLILIPSEVSTDGGLFIFDLGAQTVTRLHTGSTPALPNNLVREIALSADDKYLAVARSTGLDIIDTTDPNPTNWTIDATLNTSSSPATAASGMRFCQFDSTGYILYVSYSSGVSGKWGFRVDASNVAGGIVDLTCTAGGTPANSPFVVTPNEIYVVIPTDRISKVNKTTGVQAYSTTFSAQWRNIVYDDLNDELIIAGNLFGTPDKEGLHRVADSGSAFSVTESFYSGSTPSVSGVVGYASSASNTRLANRTIPGVGFYYDVDTANEGFYSFGQQKPIGFITAATYDSAIGENQFNFIYGYGLLDSLGWRASTEGGNIATFISLANSGRLRYGYFPYNAGALQLTTAGVDFYDMVDSSAVGSVYTKLQKVRITADANDSIFAFIRQTDLSDANNPYSAMVGVVTGSSGLSMRACIALPPGHMTMRGRIRIQVTQSFSMRASIGLLRKMSMRAAIRGQRSVVSGHIFYVERDEETRLRMEFYGGNGTVLPFELSMQAHIIQSRRARMTGHFVVYNAQSGSFQPQFSAQTGMVQTLAMRALVIKP